MRNILADLAICDQAPGHRLRGHAASNRGSRARLLAAKVGEDRQKTMFGVSPDVHRKAALIAENWGKNSRQQAGKKSDANTGTPAGAGVPFHLADGTLVGGA